MKIIELKNSTEVTGIPEGSVIAFGFFDGVHIGHRKLIETARALSGGIHPTVVWTFGKMPKLPAGEHLTTNAEKCAALSDCGADFTVFEDFDTVRSLSGRDFFHSHIHSKFKPSAVVCGFNFRFGANASSHADDLASYASELGVECAIVPPVTEGGYPVSSSAVREKLHAGDMAGASVILGRPYSLTAPVTSGHRIGHTIGHPTANLRFPKEKLIPPHGVYSSTVEFEENGALTLKHGVCNIGTRPTVNGDASDITLEVYVFDHGDDLYGKMLKVSLIEMLRDERKFDSLSELSAQITKDEDAARKSLAGYGFAK